MTLAAPFLTLLDRRAEVKGSRDPLGVQQIWSRLGRTVVTNLTTVTTSVADFAVLVLGCHFAAALAETSGQNLVDVFLKWEQIAAYARFGAGDRGFRGVDTVRKLCEVEPLSVVPLGAGGDAQLLANQKSYGIWGLYSAAARSSGLVDPEARLTAVGERLAALLLARLTPLQIREIERLLVSATTLDRSGQAGLLSAIADVFLRLTADQRALLRHHLAYGGDEPSADDPGRFERQRLFADQLQVFADEDWKLKAATLVSIAARVANTMQAAGRDVATALQRICTAESVLGPAAELFEFALGADGCRIDDVAARITERWGAALRASINLDAVAALRTEFFTGPTDRAESEPRWQAIAIALHEARYRDALLALIAHNVTVMNARGGAAWILLKEDMTLDVRFRDVSGAELTAGADLPDLWRNAYFIEALRAIVRALKD